MMSLIGEVQEYGAWVERRARGFDDAALIAARHRWERVRGRVFEPEDWFIRE